MNIRLFLTVICFSLLLVACSNSNNQESVINEEHKTYLQKLGWTYKAFESEAINTVKLAPELIESYRASGILF